MCDFLPDREVWTVTSFIACVLSWLDKSGLHSWSQRATLVCQYPKVPSPSTMAKCLLYQSWFASSHEQSFCCVSPMQTSHHHSLKCIHTQCCSIITSSSLLDRLFFIMVTEGVHSRSMTQAHPSSWRFSHYDKTQLCCFARLCGKMYLCCTCPEY